MSSDSDRPLHGLAYDISAERLRAACRLGGVVLVAAPLLPFEFVGQQPIFLWTILDELHPVTAVAAFMPIVVGALLVLAARRVARASLLAWLTLLALGTWALVAKLGTDAAAWDLGLVPDSLNRRAELATLTIALAGAALRLGAEPVAAKASRAMTGLAIVGGLIFGLWPGDGEAPLQTCVRFLAALLELPDLRLVLGFGLSLSIVVFPVLAAAVAAALALAGHRRQSALLGELLTFGLPGLLFVLVARNVLLTFGDSSVVVMSGFALVLAALLGLTARSLELGGLWAVGLAQSSDREDGRFPRRPLVLSLVAASLLVGLVFVGSWPRGKGIDWPLGNPSDKAEHLFGELLPRWALSRALWEISSRRAASAAELAESRAAGNELLRAAREVNPHVAQAVAELVQRSSDLDLAGRRWFHLIEAVNEANRHSRLPYYLDPFVRVDTRGDALERVFLVYPYRISRVRTARASDATYALLDVRRLGDARPSHQRLGFSRDFQPFALVVLDEMEAYAASLATLASREPPSCTDAEPAARALADCGALLRRLSPDTEAIRRLVERHELQHQIDGPELSHAPGVLKALGGYSDAAIDEVNRELSAYLAEFVTDGVSPKLALVHVLPFVFARRGSALSFVGELTLSTLGAEALRSRSHDEWGVVFAELAAMPDDVLRQRARDAYEELFDEPLPAVELAR